MDQLQQLNLVLLGNFLSMCIRTNAKPNFDVSCIWDAYILHERRNKSQIVEHQLILTVYSTSSEVF